jgi:hypothetical protein
VSAEACGPNVSARRLRAPSPVLLAGRLALLIGLGGTLVVSELLRHPAVAARTATAQYLPSVAGQTQLAADFTLPDQSGAAVSVSGVATRC